MIFALQITGNFREIGQAPPLGITAAEAEHSFKVGCLHELVGNSTIEPTLALCMTNSFLNLILVKMVP
jgi:hypothetical protein